MPIDQQKIEALADSQDINKDTQELDNLITEWKNNRIE
jgi:hypothetical protein